MEKSTWWTLLSTVSALLKLTLLKQQGVTVIETENQPFNEERHEAVTTIPAPTEDLKGKIIDCVQKGYQMNDKVIRFPKVVVGQ